jgi:hypothetical protein
MRKRASPAEAQIQEKNMAQIFVSHSAVDGDLVNFFSRAGAGTKVKLVFEEFEKVVNGSVTSLQVENDIKQCHAIFVILSANVEGIMHTRDWVAWETGVGTQNNKDIWVFERLSENGRISVITPQLRHYVVYEPNDNYLGYVHKIIESYDDSHVLGTVLAGVGLGALIAATGGGALLGGAAGLVLSDKTAERPMPPQRQCARCTSAYHVHLPQGVEKSRCPVCNAVLAPTQS